MHQSCNQAKGLLLIVSISVTLYVLCTSWHKISVHRWLHSRVKLSDKQSIHNFLYSYLKPTKGCSRPSNIHCNQVKALSLIVSISVSYMHWHEISAPGAQVVAFTSETF